MEDEEVVQSVQKGINSSFYNTGRFSPTKEKGVHHFHSLISKFFNDKWKVMEFETKTHIEAFFKEKEDKGERRFNRIK